MSGNRRFVLAGSLLALCCLAFGWRTPAATMASYLAAYVFFLAPALGSVALPMVHALTGGAWGAALRTPLLASSRVLPWLALLALPILAGAAWLHPWVHPVVANDPDLQRQRWYLELRFFIVRGVVCVLAWLWLAHGVRRRLLETPTAGWQAFAACGLIVYLLTVSVAATDWIMSLVPAWHSSILGVLVATAQLLAAAALAVACTSYRETVVPSDRSSSHNSDLGNLLLALMLAWAYLTFMDFLTAWIADLPPELAWYQPRLQTGWHWLGAGLLVVGLFVPFAMLLSRRVKRSPLWLRSVAILLLLAQACDALWFVLPSVHPDGFALGWTDAVAWLGMGGVCWSIFDVRPGASTLETVP